MFKYLSNQRGEIVTAFIVGLFIMIGIIGYQQGNKDCHEPPAIVNTVNR